MAEERHCAADGVNVESQVLRMVSAGYLAMLGTVPAAYRTIYQAPVGSVTHRLIRTLLTQSVLSEIRRFCPTGIVATHPFPGSVAAHLRRVGRLSVPVAIAITDFMPHPLWVHEGADRYFVASDEADRRLQALGVPGDRVRVTGIPIGPAFAQTRSRRHVVGRPTRSVLVIGGGLGLGPIVEAVRSLAESPQPGLRVVVVCGANQALWQQVHDLVAADERFQVIGYSPAVPDLMARADLLVTKPGGLTCSEAMACGVPMLLLQPLPGHEEENAAYLTASGAAEWVREDRVGEAVTDLLFDRRERLAFMAEAARLCGRPDAAGAIAREFLSLQYGARYGTATA